jgi:hypothetical protein
MGRRAISAPSFHSNPMQSEARPARSRAPARGARSFPCAVALKKSASGFNAATAAFTASA